MATEAERWAAINGVRFWIRTRSDESVPVRGWPIVDDLTDGQLQALRDEDYSDFRVERRHGPDLTYNCHGMTFAWRHGRIDNTPFPVPGYKVLAGNEPPGNTDAEIQKLLHRNGYSCRWETGNVALSHSPPGGPPSIDVGDVVLYINPLLERQGESIMHSGLVIAFAKLGGVHPDHGTEQIRVRR